MEINTIHILLVDDDEDDRVLFEEALEDLALDVRLETSENGLRAMEYLQDTKGTLPDIVFLDLNMPLVSGRECLEQIRNDEDLKTIKVVIYSTSFNLDTVMLLKNLGADGYLCKPGNYSDLKKAILTAINSIPNINDKNVDMHNFVIKP